MLQVKTLALASLIALSATQGYAQSQPEPSPQMAEFFAFDREAQEAFIGNGINMIGVVASQTASDIARCMNSWYSADSESQREKHAEIIDAMRRLPQYQPAAIVLAVVEKHCGKFERDE
ncbi:hypothetical protein HPDFL43_00045 [Hoeflea phototrophica DFL-43]|jgi:hypothetical protein|uniref:Rap1a immunity protein domain-containing protein n=1 Tax=Hoeflea phototrophica (strain DSM 17068 / NCIMB 14078 / DFL-43) TaxID=411684 RepID=A9CY56_HOEPD|nr:hypothetical protein [Hoeflea phototrophica]EDQ34540.1 hypothetical protein HPDFL43_00045 [Hoeflea phototrophica DFL-43]